MALASRTINGFQPVSLEENYRIASASRMINGFQPVSVSPEENYRIALDSLMINYAIHAQADLSCHATNFSVTTVLKVPFFDTLVGLPQPRKPSS